MFIVVYWRAQWKYPVRSPFAQPDNLIAITGQEVDCAWLLGRKLAAVAIVRLTRSGTSSA